MSQTFSTFVPNIQYIRPKRSGQMSPTFGTYFMTKGVLKLVDRLNLKSDIGLH